MGKQQKHVVRSSDGRWAVREAGAMRASKTFDTKGDALSYARGEARKHGGELYIHGRDGRIQERNTYGRDPMPPKDKK